MSCYSVFFCLFRNAFTITMRQSAARPPNTNIVSGSPVLTDSVFVTASLTRSILEPELDVVLVTRGVVPPGEVGVGDGVGVGVVFVPGFGLGVISVPGVELGVTVASPVGVVVGISILVRRPPCSSSPSPGVGVGNPGSVFVML